MTREKAIKIMRKEIECLSHLRCRDCILEKVCDPNTNPTDDEYIEAFGMAINSLEIDERYELESEQIEPCEDAISRHAVDTLVDELARAISDERCCTPRGRSTATIMQDILDLPSVNPQPCEDAISRQVVLEIQEKYAEYIGATKFWQMRDDINMLPSVTPQQKVGRWINQRIIYTNATIDFKVCSECRYEFSYDAETGVRDANYCPKCGAKMQEVSE